MYTSTLKRAARPVGPWIPVKPSRSLYQLTMGFAEIKKWKEHQKSQAESEAQGSKELSTPKLKVYTPINQSSTWNISYPTTKEPDSRLMAPIAMAPKLLRLRAPKLNITIPRFGKPVPQSAPLTSPILTNPFSSKSDNTNTPHDVGQYQWYSDEVGAGRTLAGTYWGADDGARLEGDMTEFLGRPARDVLSALRVQELAEKEEPHTPVSNDNISEEPLSGYESYPSPYTCPEFFFRATKPAAPRFNKNNKNKRPLSPDATEDTSGSNNKKQKTNPTTIPPQSRITTGTPMVPRKIKNNPAGAAAQIQTIDPRLISRNTSSPPEPQRSLPLFLGGGPFI